MSATQTSYDAVADEYVRRIYDELRHKPLDREWLDRFAATMRDVGEVCDLGCGPGHVTRHLHDQGVQICGIDLSPEMIVQARRLNPGIDFRQGDMTELSEVDETWAGITAFYSIIHIPHGRVVQTLREMRRVLKPGGRLLMAFHIGDNPIHLDEWWGHEVCLDFFYFSAEEMSQFLKCAGFEIEEIVERDPYPEVESQTRRAYILARRVGESDAIEIARPGSQRPKISPQERVPAERPVKGPTTQSTP